MPWGSLGVPDPATSFDAAPSMRLAKYLSDRWPKMFYVLRYFSEKVGVLPMFTSLYNSAPCPMITEDTSNRERDGYESLNLNLVLVFGEC